MGGSFGGLVRGGWEERVIQYDFDERYAGISRGRTVTVGSNPFTLDIPDFDKTLMRIRGGGEGEEKNNFLTLNSVSGFPNVLTERISYRLYVTCPHGPFPPLLSYHD